MEVDPVHLLPTGKIGTVRDNDFLDFTKPKALRKDINRGDVTPRGGMPLYTSRIYGRSFNPLYCRLRQRLDIQRLGWHAA